MIEKVIDFLNEVRIRATYGVVGEALGIPAQQVGGMLGERNSRKSWIVSARTHFPTGYQAL